MENTINQRLKKLRLALNMTQNQFGPEIDAAQTYLSQIEIGDRDVTEKMIRIICLKSWDGRRVNEDWFRTGIGGDENMFLHGFAEDEYTAYAIEIGNGASDVIKKAIIKYGRLSPKNKKIIDDALKVLEEMIKEG